MQEADVIKYLVEGLRHFQTGFNTSAYSTMGFTVVAGGWLITSKSARAFVHANRCAGSVAIALIIAAFLGYALMCLRVQALSQGIYDQLLQMPKAKGLFEYYLITFPGALIYIGLQALASAFVILALIAALKNPVAAGGD